MGGDNYPENLKIAVALRAARAALGWNQQEFADLMQVAKSTIARIETMEVTARGDFLTRALAMFHRRGVEVKMLEIDEITLVIDGRALREARDRLQNELLRRSDRRSATRALIDQPRLSKSRTQK